MGDKLNIFGLMQLVKDYHTYFDAYNKVWPVVSNKHQLQANIDEHRTVRYYVNDIYNNSTEYEEINMEALDDLKKVVETLMKNDLLNGREITE